MQAMQLLSMPRLSLPIYFSSSSSSSPPTLGSQQQFISVHEISPKLQKNWSPSSSMAAAGEVRLEDIAVDYGDEAVEQDAESGSICVTFDQRGGARWRSSKRFLYGSFSASIRCPAGDTSGLNCNIYLSSMEGDRSQDEIDFEFLGSSPASVQTNFYTRGVGGREQIHDLGFHSSHDFHRYQIIWEAQRIEWLIDGRLVRVAEARTGEPFPGMPMHLYASVWNASHVDEGRWVGPFRNTHSPYLCTWKDICVPRSPAL